MGSRPRCLFVEDDPFKLERILEALDDIVECKSVARSVHAAVERLQENRFDMIFLDIALPSHDNNITDGAPLSLLSGGLEVLYELEFSSREDIVVILTQYPEIEFDGELLDLDAIHEKLSSLLNVHISKIIHYEADDEQWKIKTRNVVEEHFG